MLSSILSLSPAEATFERRGFSSSSPTAQARLESVGQAFISGYNAAVRLQGAERLAAELADTSPELQGFAFEGAAMGLGILDFLTPWNRGRWSSFLSGPAGRHVYMVHVGLGLAMARFGRRPQAIMERLDPLLGWLVVDGYGFHEGYFHGRQAIDEQRVPGHSTGALSHVFDQGLGRSLWFVKGGAPDAVVNTVNSFAAQRRPDLWSGIGLAAAYAGGVEPDTLRDLVTAAGAYRADMAQGAAFAAKTRQRAGNLADHTAIACEVICEASAEDAAALTDHALDGLAPADGEPAYQVWRARIREHYLCLVAPREAIGAVAT